MERKNIRKERVKWQKKKKNFETLYNRLMTTIEQFFMKLLMKAKISKRNINIIFKPLLIISIFFLTNLEYY